MAHLFSQDEVKIPDAMESRYQRYLVNVCLLIGIPVLGYFMIYDFIIGRHLISFILALMFLILLVLFLITKRPSYKATENNLYKYIITCFFVLFGFYLAYSIGFEANTDRMPWAFLFAILVFFAFGATIGIIWTSVLYAILLFFELTIHSEKGARCCVKSPWAEGFVVTDADGKTVPTEAGNDEGILCFATVEGGDYALTPKA